MCKIYKNIKNTILTFREISDEMFSEFFLGDVIFTFLPIGMIALIDYFFENSNNDIISPMEWSFSCIMIASLALTRMLELKVKYQNDNITRILILSRFCIILLTLSVLSLFFSIFRERFSCCTGESFATSFQKWLLFFGVFFLCIVHYYKALFLLSREKFPKKISEDYFHHCLFNNLKESKKKIRANCLALNKEYDFSEKTDDPQMIEEYGKQALEQLVEDIQNDLNTFKQRLDAWNKPPYHSAIPPEQQQDESL